MFKDLREKYTALWQSKLGSKLIFSHLLVALGSLLIFMLVTSFAVQSYFANYQRKLIDVQAQYIAKYYEDLYLSVGSSWDQIPTVEKQGDNFALLLVVDQANQPKLLQEPSYLSLSQAEISLVQQSIHSALGGETVAGYLQGDSSGVFSGYYVCRPLSVHGQRIGAVLLADPEIYPQGFSPASFLTNVSTALLWSGVGLALIVAIFSLFFVHRLTRPLVHMKRAVDRLSAGNYSERVVGPFPLDELGQLAHSFNNMARQIEEDIAALQRQEQYRREITANIAHDLSTPLSSIRAFSEALADGVLRDEQARADAYAVIIRESERLSLLIKDVRQLSSLESGQIAFDYALVDLATLVKETVEVITLQCEEAGIVLHNNVNPADKLLIFADSNRIVQVLLNLFDNARRHTPPGGSITIEGALNDGRILLWIKDSGTGIAPADLPHIFERFYRADPARTSATGSSGLGLAIVKTIVTMHGGTIQAASEPGQGTSMLLTFPSAVL